MPKRRKIWQPTDGGTQQREPPKVSINGVLKIADKDGTTYGKAVLAHNI